MSTFNARYAGREAFTNSDKDGRRTGEIFCTPYKAHRVVWALHYGEWPKGEIDHINGDPSDNRICNLRDVPHSKNQKNLKRRYKSKKPMGVQWRSDVGKWRARITVDGQFVSLGYFYEKEDAIKAREIAERRYGFGPSHGRAR